MIKLEDYKINKDQADCFLLTGKSKDITNYSQF